MTTAALRGNTASSYGSVAKTFHWLTALLILTAIPLGLVANGWPFDTSEALATKSVLFSLHKTIGVTVFFVALMRILWAATQPKPALLHPDRRLETFAAETVHWLLYVSLVIVPLSGWLHHVATSGFAPIWWPFGQTLPLVPRSETVAAFFAGWHTVFTKVLAASVLLHVAGALKHHFVDRDSTLARMLPGSVSAAPAVSGRPQDRAPLLVAGAVYAAAIAVGSIIGLSRTGEDTVPVPTLQASPSGWVVESGTLGIEVGQLGSPVEGGFEDWTAAIEFDPDAPAETMGSVRVEISVPSLRLGSVTEQALGTEFFAADTHPVAVFDARISATPQSETPYVADGTLSLRGASVPLSLPFSMTLTGDAAEMSGQTVLDRRDFGIGTASYNDEKTVAFDVTVTVDLRARRSE